jgi:hypothetical protein
MRQALMARPGSNRKNLLPFSEPNLPESVNRSVGGAHNAVRLSSASLAKRTVCNGRTTVQRPFTGAAPRNRFLAKALPDPDLKYRLKRASSNFIGYRDIGAKNDRQILPCRYDVSPLM